MKYLNNSKTLLEQKSPCIATSLKHAKKMARDLGATKQFNHAIRDFSDKPGINLCIQLDGKIERIFVIGGVSSDLSLDSFRKLMATIAILIVQMPIREATFDLLALKNKEATWEKLIHEISRAISNAAYQYNKHKSQPTKKHSVKQIRFNGPDIKTQKFHSAIKFANALEAGLQIAKDLGNEPPNVCNPNYLLKESRKLGKSRSVKVSNISESKMNDLGMGAFLSVSKGSEAPGQMIVIRYDGGKTTEAPIVLIGKGITFDTGGISLKPPAAMDEMKFDMCGAASVIGATTAAIEANLKVNLITIVAAAENMPSGKATRPGDIVKSYSGKTIEILNTDAEGRLVLCDAITYAKSFKPRAIIDVATLTGACIVALGSHASALYSNNENLANSLEKAAAESGDKAWRMPLWDEYQANLKSNFADMANVGGREAGSVVAACFLSRFADNENWAHLDVAGSAFHSGPRKGSSGRPVPLLFKYLQDQQS